MSGSQLADVLDRKRVDERQRATRALLRRPLLTAEGTHARDFQLVRSHADELRRWFATEVGWTLSIDATLARLRKTPATNDDATRAAHATVGARAAFGRRRYVLTCLALAALERSERQVTLGWLVDRVVALAADPALVAGGIAFTLEGRDERRDLVAVASLLLSFGLLRKVAGDEQSFVDERGDALYDIDRRVLAELLVTRRGASTVHTESLDGRLAVLHATPAAYSDEAINREIRHHLARRLLDDPVLYYDDLDDAARTYLASQRGHLLRRLCDGTGLVAELRAEGIALLDPTGETTDLGMPEEGTDGHATLLLAEQIADRLRANASSPEAVTIEWCRTVIAAAARTHTTWWRRDATQPGAERELTAQALWRLTSLGLVRVVDGRVHPRPAIARYSVAEPKLVGGGSTA